MGFFLFFFFLVIDLAVLKAGLSQPTPLLLWFFLFRFFWFLHFLFGSHLSIPHGPSSSREEQRSPFFFLLLMMRRVSFARGLFFGARLEAASVGLFFFPYKPKKKSSKASYIPREMQGGTPGEGYCLPLGLGRVYLFFFSLGSQCPRPERTMEMDVGGGKWEKE
jgi:hypothetical protein